MANVANVLSIPRALRLFQRKRVDASCSVSDSLGACVYIYGDYVGDFYQVRTCDPLDIAKMPAVGIIVEKYTTTDCSVQLMGEIPSGLYAGLTPNSPLFVGLDGQPTHVSPLHPTGGTVYIHRIGEASSTSVPLFWPFHKLVKRYGTGADRVLSYQSSGDLLEEVTPTVSEKIGQVLLGAKNGLNRIFTTPEKFLPLTIRVYHNGRRLVRATALSPAYGDYYVMESGGPGTGYDTVIFLSFTPVEKSGLLTDYAIQ